MTNEQPLEGLAAYLRSQAHGAMCADEEEQLRRWADEVEALEQRAELAEQAHAAAAEELELLRAEREALSLPQGDARTPQDYAIEHAEYMAESAMRLVDAVLQEEFLGERDEQETSLLDAAAEETSEAIRSVRTSVYEFRKRRDRALAGRLAAPAAIPADYAMVLKEPVSEDEITAALRAHCLMADSGEARKDMHRALTGFLASRLAAPQPQPAGVPQQAQSEREAFEAYFYGEAAPQPVTSSSYEVAWAAWRTRAAQPAEAGRTIPAAPEDMS